MKNKKQIIFIALLLVMSVIGFLVGYYSNITLNNTNIHDCSSAAYSAIS